MPNDKYPINRHTEISGTDPQRVRPTDRQMGLGGHNIFKDKEEKLRENKK